MTAFLRCVCCCLALLFCAGLPEALCLSPRTVLDCNQSFESWLGVKLALLCRMIQKETPAALSAGGVQKALRWVFGQDYEWVDMRDDAAQTLYRFRVRSTALVTLSRLKNSKNISLSHVEGNRGSIIHLEQARLEMQLYLVRSALPSREALLLHRQGQAARLDAMQKEIAQLRRELARYDATVRSAARRIKVQDLAGLMERTQKLRKIQERMLYPRGIPKLDAPWEEAESGPAIPWMAEAQSAQTIVQQREKLIRFWDRRNSIEIQLKRESRLCEEAMQAMFVLEARLELQRLCAMRSDYLAGKLLLLDAPARAGKIGWRRARTVGDIDNALRASLFYLESDGALHANIDVSRLHRFYRRYDPTPGFVQALADHAENWPMTSSHIGVNGWHFSFGIAQWQDSWDAVVRLLAAEGIEIRPLLENKYLMTFAQQNMEPVFLDLRSAMVLTSLAQSNLRKRETSLSEVALLSPLLAREVLHQEVDHYVLDEPELGIAELLSMARSFRRIQQLPGQDKEEFFRVLESHYGLDTHRYGRLVQKYLAEDWSDAVILAMLEYIQSARPVYGKTSDDILRADRAEILRRMANALGSHGQDALAAKLFGFAAVVELRGVGRERGDFALDQAQQGQGMLAGQL